jgi:hypothetical protein
MFHFLWVSARFDLGGFGFEEVKICHVIANFGLVNRLLQSKDDWSLRLCIQCKIQ